MGCQVRKGKQKGYHLNYIKKGEKRDKSGKRVKNEKERRQNGIGKGREKKKLYQNKGDTTKKKGEDGESPTTGKTRTERILGSENLGLRGVIQ